MLVSGALGALVSLYLIFSGRIDDAIAGNFALSTTEAIVALAILVIVFLPACFFWQRSIDEHEAAAAKSGALLALYTYMYVYIAWATAAAAQLTPPVHDFALFMIVIFTFMGRWVFKRSG